MINNEMEFIKGIPMPFMYGRLIKKADDKLGWEIDFANNRALEILEKDISDLKGKDLTNIISNLTTDNEFKDVLLGKSEWCVSYFSEIRAFLKITKQNYINNYSVLYINLLIKPFDAIFPRAKDKIVYVKDKDGLFVDCNEGFEKLTSINKESVYGKTDIDIWGEELGKSFQESRLLYLNNQELYAETFCTFKNAVYSIKREAVYHNGVVVALVVFVDTLKLTKKKSEIVTYSEKISNLIKDTIPDNIYYRDTNGVYLDCNESFLTNLGLTRQEVIGKKSCEIPKIKCINELIERTDKEVIDEKAKKIFVDEYIIDGKHLLDETIKAPFYDSYGKVIGVVGITRDVSHRKEMDSLRLEFFANLSHELRTPLNLIFSSLQVAHTLEKEVLLQNPRLDKYINIIDQNAKRLLKLVNNLIDSTKIDCGYYEYYPQRGNIVSFIENISMSVAEFAAERGISLTFDTFIEEKWMDFDFEKLERIILNLLSNSIKYNNNPGKITVELSEDSENFIISIIDTGIGIPQDMLQAIFEKFKQVEHRLRKRSEGSGIGLALTKSLVEIQGGTIEVESELEKGSKFTVKLPIKSTISGIKNKEIREDDIDKGIVTRMNIEFSDIYNYTK